MNQSLRGKSATLHHSAMSRAGAVSMETKVERFKRTAHPQRLCFELKCSVSAGGEVPH